MINLEFYVCGLKQSTPYGILTVSSEPCESLQKAIAMARETSKVMNNSVKVKVSNEKALYFITYNKGTLESKSFFPMTTDYGKWLRIDKYNGRRYIDR